MPHVGIERLGAGESQNDGPHREKGTNGFGDEELNGVGGIDHRQDHAWLIHDVDEA